MYTERGNYLIYKSAFVFKDMSYDCLGIFCRTYLFYWFTKKYFEGRTSKEKKQKNER